MKIKNIDMKDFKDGIWRYYDAEGKVWRRYSENAYGNKKNSDGTPRVKNGWGSDGEMVNDKRGEHFMLTNGIKVYTCNGKQKKKKDGA